MARNVRTASLYVIASIVFFLSLYNHLFYHDPISGYFLLRRLPPLSLYPHNLPNHALRDDTFQSPHQTDAADLLHPSSHLRHLLPPPPGNFSSVSFLFPAWEVLVVVSRDTPVNVSGGEQYYCHFDTTELSPATPAGILQNPTRDTFICSLPTRVRRRLPFHQPILSTSSEQFHHAKYYNWPELLRWNHVVYDSFTTDDDVVLFVKGMNTRQGVNRNATEFRCVFGNRDNVIKTAVTSSLQEVFRCQRPNITSVIATPTLGGFEKQEPVKVALEDIENNHVVPSLAYYTPPRTLADGLVKSQLCACTMVYNVAKVLKEWVMYNSKIGVEKFILYDNGSDDDFGKVVKELVREGYDVETIFWLWPKTQEAGFSHCAVRAKDSCNWMMYVDVDEFVHSPSWSFLPEPSNMLQTFLPQRLVDDDQAQIGEIVIACYEFGPSHQKSHPEKGVMQGYNCRRRLENRHKSIVRLDAIHDSLLNVIHHFHLKEGFKVKRMNVLEAVVNHYKFQAWPEFKAKFRRRVSAYVVDWTVTENAKSNDRTPGLGFTAVEPEGWEDKFCEVYDNGLKNLTRRWFGIEDSPSDFHMIWQRI